jgi:hypothetical protein
MLIALNLISLHAFGVYLVYVVSCVLSPFRYWILRLFLFRDSDRTK